MNDESNNPFEIEKPMPENTEEKNLGGRPTKYDPKFCDKLLELKKQGYSDCEVCAEFDIDRSTFYRWLKKHEGFCNTNARARVHAQAWWERQGRLNLTNKEFQGSVWLKQMHNRFPEDYRNSIEVNGKIDGDHTLKHKGVKKKIDLSGLSVEELEKLKVINNKLRENNKFEDEEDLEDDED